MIDKCEFYSPILHTRSLPHGGIITAKNGIVIIIVSI